MPTLLSSGEATARTRHRCEGCANVVQPGERYYRQGVADGGEVYTWRLCLECRAIAHHVFEWHHDSEASGIGWSDFVDWAEQNPGVAGSAEYLARAGQGSTV